MSAEQPAGDDSPIPLSASPSFKRLSDPILRRRAQLTQTWLTLRLILQASGIARDLRRLTTGALALLLAAALAAGYLNTQTPVLLDLDGNAYWLGTHQATVGAALSDAGLALHPLDRVSPALDTPIQPGLTIHVARAHHVTIHVDGRVLATRTHERAALAILTGLAVRVSPADEVLVDGRPLGGAERAAPGEALGNHGNELASLRPLAGAGAQPQKEPPPPPALIEVRRAVQLTIDDDGTRFTIQTTRTTLGSALHEAGVRLYLGDSVQPALWTRVSAGLTVQIHRSVPVTIRVDGQTVRTRTFRASVAEVLADTGVVLVGEDYTLPVLTTAVTPELVVDVVRVKEEIATEQELIAYESIWQGDPTLELDYQRVNQTGAPGIRQRRIRVRYENGLEVSRVQEDEWVLQEPVTQINAYGTQIVIRTLETPDGPIEYWRTISVLATSYSASTAGTPRSAPWYGYTATGLPMGGGIIAVDPRIIPLHTQLYVPGYGRGAAEDTGGAIKNRRIDLGYDDDKLRLWYGWVDVYLLTPAPDPSRIQYVLGNWPPQ